MNWKKDEYLASWPKAVPYPYALARSGRPVPNRSSVDWPQAQWAPLYLPPGSPSVQPYRYPANVPLESISIVKMMRMLPPTRDAQRGPAGDIVATDNDCLPSSYGAITGPVVRQGMIYSDAYAGPLNASLHSTQLRYPLNAEERRKYPTIARIDDKIRSAKKKVDANLKTRSAQISKLVKSGKVKSAVLMSYPLSPPLRRQFPQIARIDDKITAHKKDVQKLLTERRRVVQSAVAHRLAKPSSSGTSTRPGTSTAPSSGAPSASSSSRPGATWTPKLPAWLPDDEYLEPVIERALASSDTVYSRLKSLMPRWYAVYRELKATASPSADLLTQLDTLFGYLCAASLELIRAGLFPELVPYLRLDLAPAAPSSAPVGWTPVIPAWMVNLDVAEPIAKKAVTSSDPAFAKMKDIVTRYDEWERKYREGVSGAVIWLDGIWKEFCAEALVLIRAGYYPELLSYLRMDLAPPPSPTRGSTSSSPSMATRWSPTLPAWMKSDDVADYIGEKALEGSDPNLAAVKEILTRVMALDMTSSDPAVISQLNLEWASLCAAILVLLQAGMFPELISGGYVDLTALGDWAYGDYAMTNPEDNSEPSFLEKNGLLLAGAGAIAAILYFNRGKKSSSGSSKQVNWEEAYKTLKWCHNPKR